MRNGESKLDFLGATPKERFQAILDTAIELCREKYLDEYTWRTSIARLIANMHGHPEKEHLVYGFLNTIGAANLTLLRIACIGNTASERVLDKQSRRKPKKRLKHPDGGEAQKQSSTLFEIAMKLPREARTLRGVSEASGRKIFIIKSFAYQNAQFRKLLTDGHDALLER